MADLAVVDLHVTQAKTSILNGISMSFASGELVALVGPNGAGKTTLLRAALGLLPIKHGQVRWDGADPVRIASTERARKVAYLPQTRPLAWPLSVEDVVALGRFAYGAPMRRLQGEDEKAVEKAIADCRLGSLRARDTSTLSGGEVSRVHLARALAAQTPLLVADEPTAALDPLFAFETMSILKRYCAQGGGALVTLHDLSLAARFADRIILLHDGAVLAHGTPVEVLTPAHLAVAYGVNARLMGEQVVIDGPLNA